MRGKMKNKISQKEWWKFLMVAAGTILFSTGINLFLTPLGLYNGGALGISQLARTTLVDILKVPIPKNIDISGIVYFILNIGFLALLFYMYTKTLFAFVSFCLHFIFLMFL